MDLALRTFTSITQMSDTGDDGGITGGGTESFDNVDVSTYER